MKEVSFKVGDMIVYPGWCKDRCYKVIRRHLVRRNFITYDVMDVEIGLVFKRVGLKGCAKVGEDCSRGLAS